LVGLAAETGWETRPTGRTQRSAASWDKFENLSGPCGGAPVTLVFVPVDSGFLVGLAAETGWETRPTGRTQRSAASWDKFENLSGPCGGAPVTSCAPCGHGRTSTPVGVIEISRGSSEANTPGNSPPKMTGTPKVVRERVAQRFDGGDQPAGGLRPRKERGESTVETQLGVRHRPPFSHAVCGYVPSTHATP
jgi:hypothetical protein